MSPRRTQLPPALRTLVDVGGSLVRQSSSGRVALARAAGVVPAAALPAPLREGLAAELAAAREASLEPLEFKRVERTLRDAWGRAPGQVLDEIDHEPLAVTPVSQVHAGERDGAPVAVKVRRPGLAAAVRNDLVLLDALAAPLGAAFPALDVGAALREARESALDELDLEHEAGLARQARRALRRVEGLVVPEVHTDLAADDVLVAQRLEGPTLAEAEPEDPGAVARLLVRAHVTAWREGGLILTDPRPSHVILMRGGEVGLLGTGVARTAGRARLSAGLDAFAALARDNAAAFAGAVAGALGLLPDEAAHEAHRLLRRHGGDLIDGRAPLSEPALGAVADRALRDLGAGLRIAAQGTPDRADLAAARMLGQLVLLLSRLGVAEDWAGVAAGA